MKSLNIVLYPETIGKARCYKLSVLGIRLSMLLFLFFIGGISFFVFDYVDLITIENNYKKVIKDNKNYLAEAKILEKNLEKVREALKQVEYYTHKLNEITELAVISTSKKGIGSLTKEEYRLFQKQQQKESANSHGYIPLGIITDKLKFRPLLTTINNIREKANRRMLDLRHVISLLSMNESRFNSLPSIYPVKGWITSGFGKRKSPFTNSEKMRMHWGLDIAARAGTPVFSPADGVVVIAGRKPGFGNYIMIAHGNGINTRYGHLAQIIVREGRKVKFGTQIGTVGMSGRATGPHLHYEVVYHGKRLNPQKFIFRKRQ